MLNLNVNNETSRLLAVLLGTAKSNGPTPSAEECYDPKSRQNILNQTYPTEKDMVNELNQLENVLLKYQIKVFRPDIIDNYNQIFSRDIGFVIDDYFIKTFILNMDQFPNIFLNMSRKLKPNDFAKFMSSVNLLSLFPMIKALPKKIFLNSFML